MFVKILFCLMVLAAFPKFVASLMSESVVVSFAKIFWYARLVSLHFPFCKYCFFSLWLLVFAGFVQVLYVLIL